MSSVHAATTRTTPRKVITEASVRRPRRAHRSRFGLRVSVTCCTTPLSVATRSAGRGNPPHTALTRLGRGADAGHLGVRTPLVLSNAATSGLDGFDRVEQVVRISPFGLLLSLGPEYIRSP